MTDKPPFFGVSCTKYDGFHILLYNKEEADKAKEIYKVGGKYNGFTIVSVNFHVEYNIAQFYL